MDAQTTTLTTGTTWSSRANKIILLIFKIKFMKNQKIKITSITQAAKLIDVLNHSQDEDIKIVVTQLYDILDKKSGL